MDLLIGVRHVNFGLVLCSGDVVPDHILVWEQRHILDSVVILLSCIHDCLKLTILFGNAEQWCSLRCRLHLPPFGCQVPVHFVSELALERVWALWVMVHIPLAFINKRDLVIDFAHRWELEQDVTNQICDILKPSFLQCWNILICRQTR